LRPAAPVRDPRPGLSGVDPVELAAWLDHREATAFRSRQIGDAVWRGLASTTDDMRTLPASLRGDLARSFRVDTIAATELRIADEGRTEKGLHLLSDGALVESVLMQYPARPSSRERHTLCISSQAGCAVGCPFCATGELGFARDLETAEMLDQVRAAARRVQAVGRRLTNVVFMGMGEPLLNLDRVLEAVTVLADPVRPDRGGVGPPVPGGICLCAVLRRPSHTSRLPCAYSFLFNPFRQLPRQYFS
jgi:23S rRNA (adenine2503-C2)-methyltransferase